MKKLEATSRFLSRCAFGGLLLVGIPGVGVAQTDGLGPVKPPSPFARFPGFHQRRPDLAASAHGQQAAVAALPEAAGTFITFDAPGACRTPGTSPGCTDAVAINPAGGILGYSVDANGMPHGFLRDSNGTFTSFDVPGAVLYSAVFTEGPPGSSLNPQGEATGGYLDVNFVEHGFIRDKHGAITTFDAPAAVNGTNPLSINPAGEITGSYFDAGFFGHGFFRDASGNITQFDAPGAGTDSTGCSFGLTFPTGINAAGEITGQYFDPQCLGHGFLRTRNGALSVVDVPDFSGGTGPVSINEGGDIAGWGFDSTGAHGFVRERNGSIAIFDIPDVLATGNMDINSAGVVTGAWLDGNVVSHSFRRTPDGTITSIDFPGAGTGFFQGTFANSINARGQITGGYNDANGVLHGFLFQPNNGDFGYEEPSTISRPCVMGADGRSCLAA